MAEIVVELPLRRCDDAELTCFICGSRAPCDYETIHLARGRHVTIGVHLACARALRATTHDGT